MLIIVIINVNDLDLDSVIQCLYLINNLQESLINLLYYIKYVDRSARDCDKSPIPLFNVVRQKLAVQLMSFVLYCVPDNSLRTCSQGGRGTKIHVYLPNRGAI